MKKNSIFRGVGTALITPMKNGSINYRSLSELIERQIEGGVSALVVGGTTGEAATLTDSERYELFSYTKATVRGRVALIFGTGTNDTAAAVRHTRAAEGIGCDGVLVVTPYYNKGTYRGVTEHYKTIAASTSLPVMLYNVPSRTGVNLTVSQLRELSEVDNIVALKEASDSLDRLMEISTLTDGIDLYAGNDSQIYETLALGGVGVISVLSNLYPRSTADICEAVFQGRYAEALAMQKRFLGLIKALFLETNPAPLKYAMSVKGLAEEELRSPLYPVEKSTRDAIEREISLLECDINN